MYLDLVDRMPDNHRWHHALRRVMGLGAGDVERLVTLYASLREKFPSQTRWLASPLDFLAGDAKSPPRANTSRNPSVRAFRRCFAT